MSINPDPSKWPIGDIQSEYITNSGIVVHDDMPVSLIDAIRFYSEDRSQYLVVSLDRLRPADEVIKEAIALASQFFGIENANIND